MLECYPTHDHNEARGDHNHAGRSKVGLCRTLQLSCGKAALAIPVVKEHNEGQNKKEGGKGRPRLNAVRVCGRNYGVVRVGSSGVIVRSAEGTGPVCKRVHDKENARNRPSDKAPPDRSTSRPPSAGDEDAGDKEYNDG